MKAMARRSADPALEGAAAAFTPARAKHLRQQATNDRRERLVKAFREIADILLDPPSGAALDLIDQHMSDMSVRRHCAAVRRRMSQGLSGAFVDGRRHLLSREALAEELGRSSRPRLALAKPSVVKASARQRMLDKLRGGRT
jgi:hypothetical protein